MRSIIRSLTKTILYLEKTHISNYWLIRYLPRVRPIFWIVSAAASCFISFRHFENSVNYIWRELVKDSIILASFIYITTSACINNTLLYYYTQLKHTHTHTHTHILCNLMKTWIGRNRFRCYWVESCYIAAISIILNLFWFMLILFIHYSYCVLIFYFCILGLIFLGRSFRHKAWFCFNHSFFFYI